MLKVYNAIGRKIDMLFFDACVMQMVEIAYQIKDEIKLMVGSEESMWFNFPYDNFAQYLINNPQISIKELSSKMVEQYIDSCEDKGHTKGTLSAINMERMVGLSNAISYFAQTLENHVGEYLSSIENARSNTEYFDYDGNMYIDICNFAELIKGEIANSEIEESAQQLISELNSAIIVEGHLSGHQHVHGLSIYFPLHKTDFETSYCNTDFAIYTYWDEFLQAYYSAGGG